MSRAGREAAQRHGDDLPRFASYDEAERSLFECRDRSLGLLRAAAVSSEGFRCDFTAESLKALERWYFGLLVENGFASVGLTRSIMEQAMSFYLGQVLTEASGFEWVVQEYAFKPGAFEIGVRRGLVTMMLTRPSELAARPNNKRRDSLWRMYRKLAA